MMAASAVLSTASTMRASDGAGSPVAGEELAVGGFAGEARAFGFVDIGEEGDLG